MAIAHTLRKERPDLLAHQLVPPEPECRLDLRVRVRDPTVRVDGDHRVRRGLKDGAKRVRGRLECGERLVGPGRRAIGRLSGLSVVGRHFPSPSRLALAQR
jgi:hypothetical protein